MTIYIVGIVMILLLVGVFEQWVTKEIDGNSGVLVTICLLWPLLFVFIVAIGIMLSIVFIGCIVGDLFRRNK